jgi:hypothetical protein
METIEQYITMCAMSIISLESLEQYHIRAVELGILKEDQVCLANSLVWDLRRLQKLYKDQAESLLDLVPAGFDVQETIKHFGQAQIEGIKKIARSRKKATEASKS